MLVTYYLTIVALIAEKNNRLRSVGYLQQVMMSRLAEELVDYVAVLLIVFNEMSLA